MARRLRKSRRMRGSRTHGWGVSGQHRKGGMKGGRGRAGWCKHKWTYTVKYALNEVGKRGFRRPAGKGGTKAINVGGLEELLEGLRKQPREGEKIKVDLTELGYEKLLGGGSIKKPVEVKVKGCSKLARKKVEEAGGNVVLYAQGVET
ncbi:TPA: 50S ribosomal protein L15 [Candidatus Bathyarchaeota archaeon]|nr:50S ribosomal protein L15 [Candidatus Bathyarchaeota archaeon]